MYVPLRRFWSIEELAPVFEHGGQVTLANTVIPCMIVQGESKPWEIVLRIFERQGRFQESLLHEFVHLFHYSRNGYAADPRETPIFHEKETTRQTARLLKSNPGIVDEITKKLILHPHCSIVFQSDDPSSPFRKYYEEIAASLSK